MAGLLLKIFNRLLGRWRGALAAGLGIALYTLLVGACPSVVRAAIMGGLSLFARQVGRRQGLPFPETLEAVQDYNLLRTGRNGWIKLTTDGEQMGVKVERKQKAAQRFKSRLASQQQATGPARRLT